MENFSNHIISGDTGQTQLLLQHLFEDNMREVPLERIRLPKLLPTFKLREVLDIANKIEQGLIDDQITVNKEYMIVKGLKRYYALKRIGRTRVKVHISSGKLPNQSNPFSFRK